MKMKWERQMMRDITAPDSTKFSSGVRGAKHDFTKLRHNWEK